MTREEARKYLPKGLDGKAAEKLLAKIEEDEKRAALEMEAKAAEAAARQREYEELLERYEADVGGAREGEFAAQVEVELVKKGARSIRAAKAMLDLEKIRKSENRAEALKKAIEELMASEEGAFLFTAQRTGRKADIGGGAFKKMAQGSGTEAIRRAAGLK